MQEKIVLANKAIEQAVCKKIKSDDLILIHSSSALVRNALIESYRNELKFNVLIADSRPNFEGKKLMMDLDSVGINSQYISINAIPQYINKVTKVMISASAILTNGDVMGSVGNAIVCMLAHQAKVPVMVLCESYKFSDNQVFLDSFFHNELGNPDEMLLTKASPDATSESLITLNLQYDVTPAKFITMVVCEHGLFPSTLVSSVIQRFVDLE